MYYLAPHRFSTRTSEVSKEKPGKELVIDANSLKISDKKSQENIAISNELELSQAFIRRALACDVVGFVSCQNIESGIVTFFTRWPCTHLLGSANQH